MLFLKYLKIVVIVLLILVTFIACQNKQENAREKLVKLKVSYNAETFIESIKNSDMVVVKLFLDSGMDPNITDKDGIPAMSYALEGHNEEAVRLLKKYGAKEINPDYLLGTWGKVDNPQCQIKITKEGENYFYEGSQGSSPAVRHDEYGLLVKMGPIDVTVDLDPRKGILTVSFMGESYQYKKVH